MPICRFLLWRILCLCFVSIFAYYSFVRHTRTVQRVRYKANYLPLYECSNSELKAIERRDRHENRAYNGNLNHDVQQRVLLIRDPSSEFHIHIVDYLNYFKLPIRIETLNEDSSLLLELNNIGRFSLIIFAYYPTSNQLKIQEIQAYAEKFHIGIIFFALSECNSGEVLCKPRQQAVNLKFNGNSSIPFIAKTGVTIDMYEDSNFEINNWTFLSASNWNRVLEAEDENGDSRSVILHKKSSFECVMIGHDLTGWPTNIAFFDILTYFLGSRITGGLTRYVQIDIDDVFVAQAGTRLLKEDIAALIKTQDDLQSFVDNFSFTLGFSGFYFRHGDLLEMEGDEQLILDASRFQWFAHGFKHNHMHEYSAENLTIIMQLNKEFAKEKQLNVSLNYAVSPQHTGIYPIHNALYQTWKDVWNVSITSTEEYPHFSPASRREGFIYQNISVLPRQTCGLFTHTLYFHALPEGLKNHQDSIFGGSLFKSLLLNQFSIFMTHQQNFGNDRLGSYTFLNLFRFMKCHTNLQFKWVTPSQLTNKYFERFPNERQLFYTDVCSDIRHVRSLSLNQTCKNVNRLPNTLIVGPQKTGTTALREFLLLHPSVSSNRDVGVGYFEEAQFFGGSNYVKGLDWYRQLFNMSTKDTTLIFEKSANYFDNPKAPKAVHQLIPSAKIIILLVDPVERAFSWYQHMKAHSDPTALKYAAMEIFSGLIDTPEINKLRNRCLQPGFYAKHLERWMDFFEPRQLIVVDGLELRNNPKSVMNLLIPALGLPSSIDYGNLLKFDDQKGFYCINNRNNGTVRCLGKGKGRKYEAMSDELRKLLNRIFEEPNRSLLNMLNYYKLKIPSFLLG